jgi:hypothetical protein
MSVSNTATVDSGSNASAGVTFTLGSGGGNSALVAYVKTSDGPAIKSQTVTVSVRVYTATPNAVRVGLQSDGTGGTTLYSAFHPGNSTFQTLAVTLTVPFDATTVYVLIRFAASCTAYLDNAMLVVGAQAADYAPLHPADDLARCQRYYETVTAASGEILMTGGQILDTTLFWVTQPFLVQKAVVPAVTFSTPSSFAVVHAAGFQAVLTAIQGMSSSNLRQAHIQGTSSGMTQGSGTLIGAAGQAASIAWEANP